MCLSWSPPEEVAVRDAMMDRYFWAACQAQLRVRRRGLWSNTQDVKESITNGWKSPDIACKAVYRRRRDGYTYQIFTDIPRTPSWNRETKGETQKGSRYRNVVAVIVLVLYICNSMLVAVASRVAIHAATVPSPASGLNGKRGSCDGVKSIIST